YLLDMSKPGKWTYFFEVFGRNTLFIYLLSELFIISLAEITMKGTTAYNWIADTIFIAAAGDYFGSLLFALWIMFSCWLIGYIMDKKGIYIKV
ncbi:MAG: DUF5009 domain-containing protein, partial [Maribacter litoralis]